MRSLRKKMAVALIAVSVLSSCAVFATAEDLSQPAEVTGGMNLSVDL